MGKTRHRVTEQVASEDVQRGDRVWHETEKSASFRAVINTVTADWVTFQLAGLADVVQYEIGEMLTVRVLEPHCGCGCGDRTKGGEFIPGHDARMPGRFADVWAKFELAQTGELGDTVEITEDDLANATALVRRYRNAVSSGRLTERIEATYSPERNCTDECIWAMGNYCVCSCGGANHRVGWMDFAARGGTFTTMFGGIAITGLPTVPQFCPGSGKIVDEEEEGKGECPVCEKTVKLGHGNRVINHNPPEGMRYNRNGDITWNGKIIGVAEARP